ncbi:hypothetical protein Pelo_12953 [Pelomyxa schiedti]|nr:hypothetical protein Pelo_12953 [Pelomyxa schiedti]
MKPPAAVAPFLGADFVITTVSVKRIMQALPATAHFIHTLDQKNATAFQNSTCSACSTALTTGDCKLLHGCSCAEPGYIVDAAFAALPCPVRTKTTLCAVIATTKRVSTPVKHLSCLDVTGVIVHCFVWMETRPAIQVCAMTAAPLMTIPVNLSLDVSGVPVAILASQKMRSTSAIVALWQTKPYVALIPSWDATFVTALNYAMRKVLLAMSVAQV